MVTSAAKPTAKFRRQELYFGLLSPRLWNMLHEPWNRWMPEGNVGDDVDRGRHHVGETRLQVAVDVAPDEVGVDEAPRQVGEVEAEVEQDDDAGPAHRPTGDAGGLVVAGGGVAAGLGPLVHPRQAPRRVDVEHERGDEPEASDPEEDGARQDRHEELTEELAVVVHLRRTLVDVQVADHVVGDEAHQHDAGDGHDPLLADGRSVELDRPRRGRRGLWTGATPPGDFSIVCMAPNGTCPSATSGTHRRSRVSERSWSTRC